ncbi:MAG: hypothetical protein J1E79_05875 [Rikenella sp.]|nr:hypothetical protein [Rikenella sp.]
MSDKVYPAAMHTAEHLLGGTMVRHFGCRRAVSTHLEKKKSKADFDFRHVGRDLTPEEVGAIEQAVNGQIARRQEVTARTLSYREAAQEFDLSRLPAAAVTDGDDTPLRIVSIGDYDRCPCIGEHVGNTAEIGRFRIVSTGYDAGSGVLRVRFRLDRETE